MPRNLLPQNYVTSSGTIIESFDSLAGLTLTNSTVSADTINFREGTQAVKMTSVVQSSSAKLDKTMAINLSDMIVFALSIYIPDLSVYDATNFGSNAAFSIYLTSNNFGRWFQKDILYQELRNGWNLIKIELSEWDNNGGEAWTNVMTKMRIVSYSTYGTVGVLPTVTFDACIKNPKGIPNVLFTFDDGWASVYTKAYPYMLSKGVKGTSWIITSLPDGTDVNYMRTADLQVMYSNGWDLGMHTKNHNNLSTLSVADIDTQISDCRDWLNSKGFTRASSHLAYPLGAYNAQVITECQKLGVKSTRTTHEGPQHMPHDSILELKTRTLANTSTFAGAKSAIDRAISTGSTIIFMIHKVADVPGADDLAVATSTFQAIIDYCVQRKVATPTISEWYAGLTNPRKKAF